MPQTSQQIRLGGSIALGVAGVTTLLFGGLSLAEHNARFILAALAPILLALIMGIIYTTQAERMARTIAARAAAQPAAKPAQAQSLRKVGQIFLGVGGAMVVGFMLLAILAHNPFFAVAALAPGLIFCSIGLVYVVTSPPPNAGG